MLVILMEFSALKRLPAPTSTPANTGNSSAIPPLPTTLCPCRQYQHGRPVEGNCTVPEAGYDGSEVTSPSAPMGTA